MAERRFAESWRLCLERSPTGFYVGFGRLSGK